MRNKHYFVIALIVVSFMAIAAQLVAQLKSEPVFGLCIITDEAATRLNGTPSTPAQKPGKRRAPRRKKSKQ